MKTSIKSIVTAIALTAVFAGPASAMIPQGDLNRDIQSLLGGASNVTATVSGNTVTLRGYFEDAGEKARALQAARSADGISRVIDLSFLSS